MTQTLSQLENSGAFIERHIGPDAAQQQEMLNPPLWSCDVMRY